MIRKLAKDLHLWLSLPVGILVTVICLTGALLVFEKEITEMLRPGMYAVEAEGRSCLQPSELSYKLEHSGILVKSLEYTDDGVVRVTQRGGGNGELLVDAYTGSVLGEDTRLAFFNVIRGVHRWLGDSPESRADKTLGRRIVGIVVLCFVVIVLTGLIVWIPRNSHLLKMRLKVETRKGWRRFVYDSHVSAGIYVLPLLLVLSLTGLTWSYGWFRYGFNAVFGADQTVDVYNVSKPRYTPANLHEWDAIYAQATTEFPDYRSLKISNDGVSIMPHRFLRVADEYRWDDRSQQLVYQDSYLDSVRMRAYMKLVHLGEWGGPIIKLLYFLAALVGATLPITGYYLWWKKRQAKNVTKH